MSDSSSSGPKRSRPAPQQLTLLGAPVRPPPPPPPRSRRPPPPPPPPDKTRVLPSVPEISGDELRREEALAPGDVVAGRYRIEARIGIGGMASVYLAHHVEIGAAVAIKVLDPELAAMRGTADRFLHEAKASSRVHHPNVVAISDFGRLDDGLPYIVMEYLAGEDLDVLVRRTGAMPWSRVRGIALQICAALQAAHDVGVVHRDVKLQNCFRQSGSGGQDFIKVLDFGIAKVSEDVLADRRALARTTDGIVVGTPDYMAPEQGRRGTVDHRADIYSLGVGLYHLVTGRLPFTANHPIEQMAQHIYEEPTHPSEVLPGIDPRVEALILRALEKNPEDRFPSMRAFAEAIDRVDSSSTQMVSVSEQPVRPARRGRAWAMLGGAALVALVAVVWASRGGEAATPTRPRPRPAEEPTVAATVDPPTASVAAAPIATAPVELPAQDEVEAEEMIVIEPEPEPDASEPVEPEPTLVVEPASHAPLQSLGVQEALRRFTQHDEEAGAEASAPTKTRRGRRRPAAPKSPTPAPPVENRVNPPTTETPEVPEPPALPPPPVPGSKREPAFGSVDPLKNPFD